MSKILYPEKDEFYCEIIAKSLAEIVRYSLDEDFRNRCLNLLTVNSTKELESEVKSKLISLIQNEKDKKGKSAKIKSSLIPGNENQKPDPALPSFNSKKRQVLQSDFDQNKKLCYYSQPLPNKTEVDDQFRSSSQIEFAVSNSQTSSSNPSQESIDLKNPSQESQELPIDDVNFYKRKFRESFKDNVHKYFRKNLNLKNSF